MKFLIACGIRDIHEDQDFAHHYYYITLQGAKTTDTYLVKQLDTRDELAD